MVSAVKRAQVTLEYVPPQVFSSEASALILDVIWVRIRIVKILVMTQYVCPNGVAPERMPKAEATELAPKAVGASPPSAG